MLVRPVNADSKATSSEKRSNQLHTCVL
uniref:Uncharacterized protein n=1 Tax=Anguilla anguilla TaxID=7936 RepID=A0A0E9VU29_ANGAN